MSPAARVLGLECLRCHARFEGPRLFAGCPRCRAEGVPVNLSVALDLTPLMGLGPDQLAPLDGPGGLWRFRSLMPVTGDRPVTLGEGATPLIHLERLGRRLGLGRLYAKDESQNPTWSYKNRLCAVAVTHAVECFGQVTSAGGAPPNKPLHRTGDRVARSGR